ncbi:thioredoxin family protein [Planctomycetales bacterium ZRK34]|nr:thioredoxin family protein [Planctomycetales bacterium ZRK34]
MRQHPLSLISALLAACVMLGATLVGAEPESGAAGDGWLIQYEQAAEQSKQSKRPILAYFTGSDWCEWCAKFEKQVLETDVFKQWADEHVILLKLDFPKSRSQADEVKQQNMKLKEKYHVKGFPTVLFLDADGQVINRTGYRPGGPDAWIKHAEHLISPAGTKS